MGNLSRYDRTGFFEKQGLGREPISYYPVPFQIERTNLSFTGGKAAGTANGEIGKGKGCK